MWLRAEIRLRNSVNIMPGGAIPVRSRQKARSCLLFLHLNTALMFLYR
jgi:hypothetical protein